MIAGEENLSSREFAREIGGDRHLREREITISFRRAIFLTALRSSDYARRCNAALTARNKRSRCVP